MYLDKAIKLLNIEILEAHIQVFLESRILEKKVDIDGVSLVKIQNKKID
jgi:hypothetical protein